MVNKIVFDYLSQYHSKYNLEDLKKKILSAGYSQADVDESLKLLGLGENEVIKSPVNGGVNNYSPQRNLAYQPNYSPQKIGQAPTQASTQTPVQKTQIPIQTNTGIPNQINPQNNLTNSGLNKEVQPVNYDNYKPKGNGFKWMKLSGILGIIYFLTIVLFSILFYFYSASFNENIYFVYVSLGIGFLFFISLFFFIYGFVKLGKNGNSGLLVFAAKLGIVLIILGIILGIGAGVVGILFAGDFFKDIEPILSEFNSGNILASISLIGTFSSFITKYLVTFIVLAVILGLYGLFLFIDVICFFIGLINVGGKVKFAKSAGILGILSLLIFILINLISLGIMIISSDIISLTTISFISFITFGVCVLFGFLMYWLVILAFFNSSRKFESGYI